MRRRDPGAWGIARVLRLEHAALRTRSVDIASGPRVGGVRLALVEAAGGSVSATSSTKQAARCASTFATCRAGVATPDFNR